MTALNQILLHPERRIGADLGRYRAAGGGKALAQALRDAASVIEAVDRAGLRGLGGSGFPTIRKWRAVAERPGKPDKYLICNGNEDEPGTFKDRLLLEETPHQVIEGALVAAVALGINRIVFYINPELDRAIDTMRRAIEQWQGDLALAEGGRRIGLPMRLELLPGSGHYVGGEETAAIEWVEGKFPFPRGKPPWPAEHGVFGMPTLVNNIETLANVPHIAVHGPAWYHALGLGDGVSGTKLYSLSGDVLRPGVYELPMGTPLRELIFDHGGGILEDLPVKAVFTGGPSNSLLTSGDLDVPLDYDSVRARGASLGTGAIIAISAGTGIVKRVAEYVNFFAHSSCGQCPPCKTGTYYAAMLLDRIDTGYGSQADLDALLDLCRILPGAGRCHLPEGVVKLLDSSFKHFIEEFRRPLRG